MIPSSSAWLGLSTLALMILAWLAAAAVTAMVLAVVLVPGHLGFGESLRGWEAQLPDPATFPQSAARIGTEMARSAPYGGR